MSSSLDSTEEREETEEETLPEPDFALELLDFAYTPFATGMKKTVELLKDLYPVK